MGRQRSARSTELEAEISTGVARIESVPGDPDTWILYVNGVPSSSITIGDPLRLDFEYLDWMARFIDTVFADDAKLRAVHIGAGACSLPRWIDAARPGSRQTAIDIDALLVQQVREWFDLPRSPALAIRAGDGADELRSFRDGSLDLLVRDAFDHDETPARLRSEDFFADAARALRSDGVLLANIADRPPHQALRAELQRIRRSFPEICVIADPGQLRGRRYGNVVVAASAAPLNAVAVAKSMRRGPAVASVLSGPELESFIGGPRG